MKTKRYAVAVLFLLCLVSLNGYSQQTILNTISKSGEMSITHIQKPMVFKNIRGPIKMIFFGDKMSLEKIGNSYKSFGRGSPKKDILRTLYSGTITSEGIIEPIVFNDKTPEELRSLELMIFPRGLEFQYELTLHMVVKISSGPTSSSDSSDSGKYRGKILVRMEKL